MESHVRSSKLVIKASATMAYTAALNLKVDQCSWISVSDTALDGLNGKKVVICFVL